MSNAETRRSFTSVFFQVRQLRTNILPFTLYPVTCVPWKNRDILCLTTNSCKQSYKIWINNTSRYYITLETQSCYTKSNNLSINEAILTNHQSTVDRQMPEWIFEVNGTMTTFLINSLTNITKLNVPNVYRSLKSIHMRNCSVFRVNKITVN